MTDGLSDIISSNFGMIDSRIAQYIQTPDEYLYEIYRNAGFRTDFVIYSMIPIIVGVNYIKKNVVGVFYRRIFCAYLLINSLWLIVIRIPFADRFASLSWLFIPFLVLSPLLTRQIYANQHRIILLYILMFLSVNAYLMLR